METFSFNITHAVIDHMGLTHDGQTVSKWVRISDLLADGKISLSDYHALASAGVVVMPQNLFTFNSVEETDKGWCCHQIEPEPRAWWHTLGYLRKLFPGGRQWQLWLPEPPTWGYYYKSVQVYTKDVISYKPSVVYSYANLKLTTYMFSEGTVTLEHSCNEWAEMRLLKEQDSDCPCSYFADGGRYIFNEDCLVRYYE